MSPASSILAVTASALSNDPREAPRLARSLGFHGLQFDAMSHAINLADLSLTGRREFRHVLASQSQTLVSMRVDLGIKGLGRGADIDRILSQMSKIMEAAVGLGTPLVCIELGPLPEPPPEQKPKSKVTQEQAGLILIPTLSPEPEPPPAPAVPRDVTFEAQVDAAMLELGALCDRFGVTLGFRSDLASFAAIERALRAARCQWFGIDLDPVAILRDDWSADEILSRLGPLLRHVRARDAVSGADKRTKPTPIGKGETNWPELLQNLDAAGYHGAITIDPLELPDRVAAARVGLEHLSQSADWS